MLTISASLSPAPNSSYLILLIFCQCFLEVRLLALCQVEIVQDYERLRPLHKATAIQSLFVFPKPDLPASDRVLNTKLDQCPENVFRCP
jgi:hypothetical protein